MVRTPWLLLLAPCAACLVRTAVKPERLPLEPAGAGLQGPIQLLVRPEAAAATLTYPSPGDLRPRPVELVASVGAEVADAWARAVSAGGSAPPAPAAALGGAPPAEAGAEGTSVEVVAVNARAWGDPFRTHVEVGVTSEVRRPGRRPEPLAVTGRGEEISGVTARAFEGAVARAVKQAAELFRARLAGAPAVEVAPARAPEFDPPGGAFRYELAVGMGVGDDSSLGDGSTAHLGVGLGWAGRRLRLGLEGGLEGPFGGDYRAGWVGAAAGAVVAGGGDERLELALGLGRRFYAPIGDDAFTGRREVSGGSAELGYASASVIGWLGPRQLSLGAALWVRTTLGNARTRYELEECFYGCVRTSATARFGGVVAGFSILWTGQVVPTATAPPEDGP